MKFDIFFKNILRKRNIGTLTPSYLGLNHPIDNLNNMYVRKRQCYHNLVIGFLIKTMISIFLYVVITTLIRFKLSITATPYVRMLLPSVTLSSFTLRLSIGWFRHKYWKYGRTTVLIWLLCFKYLLYFILWVFWLWRSDLNDEIWYILQIHFTKKKPWYADPQLLRQCEF